MIIFPAIDLIGGQAVRLYQGDYDKVTIYGNDPLFIAERFSKEGASYLHVVDLDGARDGSTANFATIEKLAAQSGLQVEIGGGIRDAETAERYLDTGVFRVILGTAALTSRDFLCEMLERFGDRIAVGADVLNGRIAVRGWRELSDTTLPAFCSDMQELGVRTIICTDISKDGAMRGTNMTMYSDLTDMFSMDIVASGGISSIDDVSALKEIGVSGAILGRALYDGAINLREAIEVAV